MSFEEAAAREQAISQLLAAESAPGWRLGLERIKRVLKVLGNPEQGLPVVHIAGTNGKGSCSTIIWTVLKEAGWKTACYMSPHIHSYSERYLLNGNAISHSELNFCLQEAIRAGQAMFRETGERATEYELLTAAAFIYFAGVKPQLLVLETGLGGIYDATNVVDPILAVITSISHDHSAILGGSLAEIASNKAGIIKPGRPVVIGRMPPEARDTIASRAVQMDSRIMESSDYVVELQGYDSMLRPLIDICGPMIQTRDAVFGLRGIHQLENLAISLRALEYLKEQGFGFDQDALIEAVKGCQLAGRMELLSHQPPVILDLAHNPDGARQLAASLRSLFPEKNRVMICGFLDDKDRTGILAELAPGTRRCYLSRPISERSRLWMENAGIFRNFNTESDVEIIEDAGEAVKRALSALAPDEYLLITGSFYLAAPVREYFHGNNYQF